MHTLYSETGEELRQIDRRADEWTEIAIEVVEDALVRRTLNTLYLTADDEYIVEHYVHYKTSRVSKCTYILVSASTASKLVIRSEEQGKMLVSRPELPTPIRGHLETI